MKFITDFVPVPHKRPSRARPAVADSTELRPSAIVHFGERRRAGKYGPRLIRDEYARIDNRPSRIVLREDVTVEAWQADAWYFEDESHTRYSDEFCQWHRQNALENFDLNMAFFARIPPESFETALREILRKYTSIQPVMDLTEFSEVRGLYILVLDDYRQVYVGQARNIRQRVKDHWNGTKKFDTLYHKDPHESVMSIDAFGALDTTRIFAVRTSRADDLEERILRAFPADFSLNRAAGGKPDPSLAPHFNWKPKRRQLVIIADPPSAIDSPLLLKQPS